MHIDGLSLRRRGHIFCSTFEPGRRVKNACHLVCYFRYVRFLPDGRLLYRYLH